MAAGGARTAPEDQEAATALANRMETYAKANNLNPKNVSNRQNVKGARALQDNVHVELSEEIQEAYDDLGKAIKKDKNDTAEVKQLKRLAKSALRQAKNKVKNTVGTKEMAAVETLVGNTREGRNLINLMRESNELTTLVNRKLKGGLSKYTDLLSPLDSNTGYNPKPLIEIPTRAALTGTAALNTGGASLVPQAGIFLGGRLVDAVTGNRSLVNRFIQDNKSGKGLANRQTRSVQNDIEQANRAAKEPSPEERQLNKKAFDRNDPITSNPLRPSPQSVIATEAGTRSPQEIVRIAEEMKRDPAYADITNELDAVINSVQYGGRIPRIGLVAGAIAGHVGNKAAADTRVEPVPARVQQGIEDNRAELDRLLQNAQTDTSLSDGDLELVRDALRDLRLDLGRKPVEAAERIVNGAEALAEDGQRVGAYLRPYLGRVRQQQAARPEVNADQTVADLFAGDPFGIGNDLGMTALDIMPTDAELASMKAGTFKPEQKKKLEQAYGDYFKRWIEAAGQDTALEYNEENVDRIGRMMATEALRAIQKDNSAIGWYDAKLKAAKAVMRLAEPRIDQNEAAFDFALAVTSNGQAVTQNFKYALDVFRSYLDNGVMPEDFKQGGDRNAAMIKSFKFFNAWERSGQNMSISEFLDADFTVRELGQFLTAFNEKHGTKLEVGSSENQDASVKGSFVLGAKIGQGFYQNIRGNYDPLTMDIWWMRMWNRLVGRPFEPPSQERDILKRRNIIKRGIIDNKDSGIRKVINQALEDTNETRQGLYTDPARFDKVIMAMHKRYQRYYQAYKKKNGKNPEKPKWMATVGTHHDKMGDKLMATPAGGGERAYMRQVTARARELLREQGYDINTADFQALMWYPEKQLAEKMGIAKGKGEDNDYLDAAILSARNEGISDGQIQEALPDAERERLFGGTSARGQDGRPDSGSGRLSAPEASVSEDRDLRKQLDLVDFTSPSEFKDRANDLINRLERMTEPEFGTVLQSKRDAIQRATPKAVKRLDPEGRQVASTVQAGLNGEGLTNEQVESIFPFLADAFNTLLTSRDGVLGKYRTQSLIMRGEIEMRPLQDMQPEQWLETFFHEFGHAIEAQSGMRGKINALRNLMRSERASDIDKAEAENIFDQMIDLSRNRRPAAWTQIDRNMDGLSQLLGRVGAQASVPSAKQIAMMNGSEYRDFASAIGAAMDAQGVDSYQMVSKLLPQLKQQIDYLYNPAELSADALALYMQNPKHMKKYYSDAAEIIRAIVNDSSVADFITFHSIAGLLGAAGMAALLKGEDDEEKGILSLGSGVLSGAA